jgi:phosphinothricin acetyltransferase
LTIRELKETDWSSVAAIFEEGIATGLATFETAAPDWPAWDDSHLPGKLRLVAEEDGEVVGFAALAPVSSRNAYRGVAENSVYVSARARGRGVGSALLNELVRRSEEAGIWTIQTSIFPENLASLAVHQRAGFRVVGRRERIGRLHGQWRDTLLLERRAPESPAP